MRNGAVHHWITQRITAVALIPLSIWLVATLMSLIGTDITTAQNFFKNPVNSVAMAAFIIAAFWHSALGLEVIIEDYVHDAAKQKATIRIIKLVLVLVAAAAVTAIITLTM